VNEDWEKRLDEIEKRLDAIERTIAVLATGVAIARWMGPMAIALAIALITTRGG